MNNSHSEAYAAAGVDITAGYKSVELMKKHIRKTEIPGVCSDVGGFGGLFIPDLAGMQEPVLVSGTDGVGTKLKIAFLMNKHDTIGIDCVAMCVNDIICCGAKPLFFLDYIACGKNVPEVIEQIVKGVCDGCVQAGCALIGGETAEHPGMMPEDEYDLAGYSTGIVDKAKIIDNKTMKGGDVIIENADLAAPVAELGGKSLGETLLTPTRIYVKPVLALMKEVAVKGVSHITGGGFYENIPRSIPDGLGAKIEKAKVKTLPIFDLIAKKGGITERDMFNTYNMGVGMSVVVSAAEADKALRILKENGEDAYVIGEIIESDDKITII